MEIHELLVGSPRKGENPRFTNAVTPLDARTGQADLGPRPVALLLDGQQPQSLRNGHATKKSARCNSTNDSSSVVLDNISICPNGCRSLVVRQTGPYLNCFPEEIDLLSVEACGGSCGGSGASTVLLLYRTMSQLYDATLHDEAIKLAPPTFTYHIDYTP